MTGWITTYKGRKLRHLGTKYVMPKAKPSIDTPAKTLREVQTKTHFHPLRDLRIEAISSTLVQVEASKVVYTWADTAAKVEIRSVD